MVNPTLAKERQALLALELTALGVDIRRLGFIRWLIEKDQDPEWFGQTPAASESTGAGFSLTIY